MDRAVFLLVCLAALGSGIVGGIFYGFSSFVMRALAQVAPEQGIAAMNAINRTVITPSFMGVFMGSTLLCLAVLAAAFMAWPPGVGRMLLVGAALLYLAGCFGLTVAVNQPMNLRLAGLSPGEAMQYWPRYVPTWTSWNSMRTAASLAAACLFVAALLVRA